MSEMKLHTFFNSSASYRARIALNLKGLEWESIPVNLRTGEQSSNRFKNLNPVGMVPTLEHGEIRISQSIAIMDYLDQIQPLPLLIPNDPKDRQKVWEISLLIACEIHPLNNLRILKYLTGPLGLSDEVKNEWYKHWILEGFDSLEKLLIQNPSTSGYCVGLTPTMADCCLVPQVANAKRMNINIDAYTRINTINNFCLENPAFQKAAPNQQPDFVRA